jgi:hypothetical protein
VSGGKKPPFFAPSGQHQLSFGSNLKGVCKLFFLFIPFWLIRAPNANYNCLVHVLSVLNMYFPTTKNIQNSELLPFQ